jgi:hypothetical protein
MYRTAPLTLFLLLAASAAGAQARNGSFGLGTSINPGALVFPGEDEVLLFQTGFNNILVPMRGQRMTLEPEFGITRGSVKQEGSFGASESKLSATRLGVGFLFHRPKRAEMEPYLGLRVGALWLTSESSSGTFNSKTKTGSKYLSGVAGAQYFFNANFSLGGEAQLIYTRIGDSETVSSGGGGGGGSSPKTSGSNLGTLGLVTIRWYF